MTPMFLIFVFVLITVSIGNSIIQLKELMAKKKEEKKEEYQPMDEVIPYKMGKYTVYLRRQEVDYFEKQPRRTRKMLIKQFNDNVKKGIFIPIKEDGKVVGYVRRGYETNNG